MYATTRGQGFFQEAGQRVHQRKTSELTGNLMRSGDLESIGGPPTANSISSPMHDMGGTQGRGSQQPTTLKVQELLRSVNNVSGQSHVKGASAMDANDKSGAAVAKQAADFMSV